MGRKLKLKEAHMVTILFYEHQLKSFNKVLNKKMVSEFDWLKKIEISAIYFNEYDRGMRVTGSIYADEDWVYNNYREVNYSQPLPDSILLGDIFFSDSKEYLKIQDIIATVFSGVIGVLKAKKVRVSEIELYPVNQDWSSDNKLRESIKNVLREITKY